MVHRGPPWPARHRRAASLIALAVMLGLVAAVFAVAAAFRTPPPAAAPRPASVPLIVTHPTPPPIGSLPAP